jgi:hypothetical protein
MKQAVSIIEFQTKLEHRIRVDGSYVGRRRDACLKVREFVIYNSDADQRHSATVSNTQHISAAHPWQGIGIPW